MDLIKKLYNLSDLQNYDKLVAEDYNITDKDDVTIDNNTFLNNNLVRERLYGLENYFSAASTYGNTARVEQVKKYFHKIYRDMASWTGTKKFMEFIIKNYVYMKDSTKSIDTITVNINESFIFYYIVTTSDLSNSDWAIIKPIIHPEGFEVLFINGEALDTDTIIDVGKYNYISSKISNVSIGYLNDTQGDFDKYGSLQFNALVNEKINNFKIGLKVL